MKTLEVWENAEPGVKRKIFQPGVELMMMEVHFEKDAVGYEHSHPHEQLSYCIKGSFEFNINGETTVLKEGQTIAIPPRARHGVKALEASVLLDSFTPLRKDLLGIE